MSLSYPGKKKVDKHIERNILTAVGAGTGALIGTAAGPVSIAFGAAIGGLAGHRLDKQENKKKVKNDDRCREDSEVVRMKL